MSSRLHAKINQYPIEKGIEFNADSNHPPTETGSLSQSSISDWSYQSNSCVSSFDGPGGGDGSVLYYLDTARRDRFNISSGNWGNALLDNNYSVGFWFKINPATYTEALLANIFTIATPTSGGFAFNVVTNGVGQPQSTSVMINYGNGIYTFQDAYNMSSNAIQFNKWYYLAVVKNGTTGDLYLNGVKQTTVTMTTGTPTSVNFGYASLSGSSPLRTSYNISNFYVASTVIINSNEITDIWNAGKTMSTPVKYWNGSDWITANSIKRWNGNTWHEINAQKRTPIEWITI